MTSDNSDFLSNVFGRAPVSDPPPTDPRALHFWNLADEFVARVKACEFSGSTAVNLIPLFTDEAGTVVAGEPNNIVPRSNMTLPSVPREVIVDIATRTLEQSVIDNINSIVRCAADHSHPSLFTFKLEIL
ncbi:hypothetical protein BH11PLA2_BH11PLA2_01840 [soil metagenome]